MPDNGELRTFCKAVGTDKKLGLVFGYAAITKQKGEDYYDHANENFTDDSILEASVDFMLTKRVLGEMHEEAEGGSVVFMWPMTEDIAKAFDVTTDTYGLMIAAKPAHDATLEKFDKGEYTGFSIGGAYIDTKEVEDNA